MLTQPAAHTPATLTLLPACLRMQAATGLAYDSLLLAIMDDNPYMSDGNKQVPKQAALSAVRHTLSMDSQSECAFCRRWQWLQGWRRGTLATSRCYLWTKMQRAWIRMRA